MFLRDNHGNGNIDLNMYVILNGGSIALHPANGIQLTAHEFAHNVTLLGYVNYDTNFPTASGSNQDYPTGFGVQAGNHEPPFSYQCERTADAIASWAVNDFESPFANDVRRHVEQFMKNVLNCMMNVDGATDCYGSY
jgi:hypothetical protein